MLELTKYFSPYDVWSPLFLVSSVLIIILYLGITGPYRRVFAQVDPVPIPKKLMFINGVLLLYLAQGGPLNIMSHMMLTFHMLMMAITYIIVPPLILLGVPAWLWKYLLDRKPLRWLKGFMHPILMAVLFNALFSFYHVPAIHDYVMTHYAVHVVYYIVLFIASMIMWWPIVVPVPEWVILSDVKKMGYIFLNGMLITPACALIILRASHCMRLMWTRKRGSSDGLLPYRRSSKLLAALTALNFQLVLAGGGSAARRRHYEAGARDYVRLHSVLCLHSLVP